jgi:hypothetical protein
MKEIITWLKDALTTKKLVEEMAYYRAADGFLKATDGRIIAGHPCDPKLSFLAPGQEFERAVNKFGDDLTLVQGDGEITLRSGKTKASIKTLPADRWDYPGIDEEEWMPVPKSLVANLRRLYPFVSDNATHIWATGITLERGWAFATNNIALCGIRMPQLGPITAIVPLWAIEFLMNREVGLISWCWTENYVAFQWANGAWMRSTLMDSYFPEQVSNMVMKAMNENPDVEIDDEFRSAFAQIAGVADSAIVIASDFMMAEFGKGTMTVEHGIVELGEAQTIWAAKFLAPVIAESLYWDPTRWPKPAPFMGDGLCGYVMGRTK